MDSSFQILLELADGDSDHTTDNAGGITMTDRQLLESFYFECKIKNLRPKSIRNYAQNLEHIVKYARYIDKRLATIEKADIQHYVFKLIESGRLSPSTINIRLRTWRAFYNYIEREQLLDHNPMTGISLLRVEHKIKPILSPQQLEMILNSFSPNEFFGARNRSLTMFLYDTACRVGELCHLRIPDLILPDRLAKVHGKSRRERFVPLSAKTCRAIHSYLVRFRDKVPGDWLFCFRNGDPLYEERVYKMLRRAGQKLDLHLYPHLLRHSGATEMLRAGMSGHVLQRILGHANPVITSRYIHLGNGDMTRLHEITAPMNGVKLN